jgi:hypothetical protein
MPAPVTCTRPLAHGILSGEQRGRLEPMSGEARA